MNNGKKSENQPRQWGQSFLATISYAVLAFLIVPVFIIIPMSFGSRRYFEFPPSDFSLRWYVNFFSDYKWIMAAWTSFKVAFFATILAVILGTLASFCFVRADFRGKELLYAFVLSPIIMPLIVLAIAIYFFFAQLNLIGSVAGLVFAHAILGSPFVILIVTATLQGFDLNLERAAMNLGANRLRTFFKITFPMIGPGMLSGAIFAFLISFDEVIIAVFICGTTATTLPKRMWDSLTMETDPTITAIATMLVVFAVSLLLFLELVRRRYLTKRLASPDQETI